MSKTMLSAAALLARAIGPHQHAQAVASFSSDEFASRRNEYRRAANGRDGIFFVCHTQEYIDGALATDERAMANVAAGYSGQVLRDARPGDADVSESAH